MAFWAKPLNYKRTCKAFYKPRFIRIIDALSHLRYSITFNGAVLVVQSIYTFLQTGSMHKFLKKKRHNLKLNKTIEAVVVYIHA